MAAAVVAMKDDCRRLLLLLLFIIMVIEYSWLELMLHIKKDFSLIPMSG